MGWNVTWGMIAIVLVISLFMTLVQKYATDQKTMKKMKEEQKRISDEMKKVKENPQKMMELQKESMKFIMPTMKLSMRSIIYTAVPLILLFRWFNDFYALMDGFRFLGFFSWFWFYLLGTLIFSSIFRKIMNVV